jgi:hypothetical protein
MQYLGMLIILVIAFYTFMYGLETWKAKNYIGFFALTALAIVVVALPVYVLFLR